MNIVLIGMRGTGKTTIGAILSKRLSRTLIETDALIENITGMRISDLVDQRGWNHFRDIESKIIFEVSASDECVIATGGGVVTRPENIYALRQHGILIWLRADIQTMEKRVGNDANRPSLTAKRTLREEIIEVKNKREVLYRNASDIRIKTDHRSPRMLVHQILQTITL